MSNVKVPWGGGLNFFRQGVVCAKGSEIQPIFVSETTYTNVVGREGGWHGGVPSGDLTVRRSRE